MQDLLTLRKKDGTYFGKIKVYRKAYYKFGGYQQIIYNGVSFYGVQLDEDDEIKLEEESATVFKLYTYMKLKNKEQMILKSNDHSRLFKSRIESRAEIERIKPIL